MEPTFSIIIPVYNEANKIAATIRNVHAANDSGRELEIVVVDGGSRDGTVAAAMECGAIVALSERKGRAIQLNKGAAVASGHALYFLHADTVPPKGFVEQIVTACDDGAVAGCFRLRFDYDHWFLRVNCWFTRFNVNAVRFGDQSLFIARDVFQKTGGFREDLLLMEDQEIIHRIKWHGRFRVLDDRVTTSARKYRHHGVYRTQCAFYLIWALYYLGASQARLVKLYRWLFTSPV